MAIITKKQVNDINAKCTNGFHVNLHHFVERGEKRLIKIITLINDVKKIEVSLYWSRPQINKGQKEVTPKLHCAVWDRSSTGGWISYGCGAFHQFIDKPSPKKQMNELCKVTELVTDKLISSMLSDADRKEFLKIARLPEE